jgi:hypothetical protein
MKPESEKNPDEALTLTVHSLPQAGEHAAAQTPRGRWALMALVLACAAPVIASYFTYYVIRPEGRTNYGTLLNPQRPMPEVNVTDLTGQTKPLKRVKDQWLLVHAGPSACDAVCEKQLYLQRQLRESLGRDKDRMDWAWIITDDAPLREALKPAAAQATVLRMDADVVKQWLPPEDGRSLSDHLYVVDPLGNLMMRFPPDADPKRMRKDLERLMRASNSWDKAGRLPKAIGTDAKMTGEATSTTPSGAKP